MSVALLREPLRLVSWDPTFWVVGRARREAAVERTTMLRRVSKPTALAGCALSAILIVAGLLVLVGEA